MKEKNNKNTLVVNLVAGPGVGKSTTMSDTFAKLKWAGIDCEMATEYAKDVVWSGNLNTLNNQLYVFAKQSNKLFRLNGKVDVIITDSPLILSLMYGKDMSQSFKSLVLEQFHQYNNMTLFLHRSKAYNPNGRYQTEDEAKELDNVMLDLLKSNNIPYSDIVAKPENVDTIVQMIKNYLHK